MHLSRKTLLVIAIVASITGIIAVSAAYLGFSDVTSPSVLPSHAIFESENSYVDHIKQKVAFNEIELRPITVKRGDNFWKIAKMYRINIDTLISANPFWQSLNARETQTVIVPSVKGVLHFINDFSQIKYLCNIYGVTEDRIIVQNTPFLYRYYASLFDKRPIAVFIKDVKPDESMMMQKLAKQFALREMFKSPLGGRYSSFFGNRLDPIVRTGQFHNGVDIAAPHGTAVGSACEGVVSSTGWMGGYGKAVIVQHRNGYTSLYGHLSSIAVRPGQSIRAGHFVGRVGSTGWSTGPHLHFTLMQNGKYINPMQVLW